MERLTLDSSVIVAALRRPEEKHHECIKLLEGIINGDFEAVEPYSVLVEVVAAVKRRTGSEQFARRIRDNLLSIDTISFEELVRFRAEKAAEMALLSGLRGMDALVVQIAKENNCVLVTLDSEMIKLGQRFVKTKTVEELLKN
ncbi:type II toxin-antitoxin system VapC family toxin [Candidatus Margulisiibacteriota bacterium]